MKCGGVGASGEKLEFTSANGEGRGEEGGRTKDSIERSMEKEIKLWTAAQLCITVLAEWALKKTNPLLAF